MNKEAAIGPDLRKLNLLLMRMLDTTVVNYVDSSLTSAQASIIVYVANNEDREQDVFQRDIQRIYNLRRSSVSLLLNNMERKGLVVRKPVAHDARLKKIELADKARSLAEKIITQLYVVEDHMVQGIDKQEVLAFKNTLHKIIANVEDQ